jgi:hypothetical protein
MHICTVMTLDCRDINRQLIDFLCFATYLECFLNQASVTRTAGSLTFPFAVGLRGSALVGHVPVEKSFGYAL